MTGLELYKFIEATGSETSFDGETAIMWVSYIELREFVVLIGDRLIDGLDIDVRLKESHVGIEMNEICEWHDIELKKVFEKDKL